MTPLPWITARPVTGWFQTSPGELPLPTQLTSVPNSFPKRFLRSLPNFRFRWTPFGHHRVLSWKSTPGKSLCTELPYLISVGPAMDWTLQGTSC